MAWLTPGQAITGVILAVCAAILPACDSRDEVPALVGTSWSLEDNSAELRAASCPGGASLDAGKRLELKASKVTLTDIRPEEDLPGATFAGAWHLTSPEASFGGLSGLDVEPDGNLLAVSDEGAFVWIEIVDGMPSGARIAQMRNADGDNISGKSWRDAEGLDLRDGLAFVSFEREHRVLAFNLGDCGAAAQAVEVARLGDRIAGMSSVLPANSGAEGLVLTAEGELLLAIEAPDSGLPIARVDVSGAAVVVGRIAPRGAPVLTGIDRVGDTLYAVLRSYVPMIGNTIEVIALPMPDGEKILPAQRVLRLEPRHGTDNFEGIALDEGDDGGLRLWLVSDDNFSSRQRTLLYAFDLR